jgi:hypothetical protein
MRAVDQVPQPSGLVEVVDDRLTTQSTRTDVLDGPTGSRLVPPPAVVSDVVCGFNLFSDSHELRFARFVVSQSCPAHTDTQ